MRHRGRYHQLEQEFRTRYHVEFLRQQFGALCIDCEGCAENRKTTVSDGPMIHLSAETRVRIWQRLGLAIGSHPVITENLAEIDPFRYEPVAVECAHPGPIAYWIASTTFSPGLLGSLRGFRSCSRNNKGCKLPVISRLSTRYSTPVRLSFNAGYWRQIFTFWPKCWKYTYKYLL